MLSRTFWVKCGDQRHRVLLGAHGVAFPHHQGEDVYRDAHVGEALSVLASIPDEHQGCYRIARLVQQWHAIGYTGVMSKQLQGDERRLFAALRGRMLGRQALRRS